MLTLMEVGTHGYEGEWDPKGRGRKDPEGRGLRRSQADLREWL